MANPEDMSSYNWARFIIDIIVQTVNAKDTKNWFKACMPYLMVSSCSHFCCIFSLCKNSYAKTFYYTPNMHYFLQILYVDSLEIDAVDVPKDVIRCLVWTNKLIRHVVDLDTDSSGSFRALPVCYP
jgi:hypothetical protein